MKMNNLVCFTIATSNGRSKLLELALENLINVFENKKFKIFISDNSSNEENKYVISNIIEKYNYADIFYYYSPQTSDLDSNVGNALKLAFNNSESKFIWLIGDSNIFTKESLKQVLYLIDKDYDLIMINAQNRVMHIESREYTNSKDIFNDLGWHLTCIGTSIYKREFISIEILNRYYGTLFGQFAIIFEYLSTKNFKKAIWLKDINILINNKKVSSWIKEPYQVFSKNWSNVILSFPPLYTLEDKLQCIRNHDKYTYLFSLRNILSHRKNNILNIKTLLKYHSYIKLSVNIPIIYVYIISLTPVFILKFIYFIITSIKSMNSK